MRRWSVMRRPRAVQRAMMSTMSKAPSAFLPFTGKPPLRPEVLTLALLRARERLARQETGVFTQKDMLEGVGFGALLAVSLLLAFNQIIVKFVNSALAVVFVDIWLWYRGLLGRVRRAGLLIGSLFLRVPCA
jgi:hypothetical protein